MGSTTKRLIISKNRTQERWQGTSDVRWNFLNIRTSTLLWCSNRLHQYIGGNPYADFALKAGDRPTVGVGCKGTLRQ
jgi:hypothetical protein